MNNLVEICDQCNGIADFNESPEGQRCGVCDDWICNNCQDCKAGLGNQPYPKEDVVCKICATKENKHE